MTERELDILADRIAEKMFVPRWMNIRQAARYGNIGQKKLITLAKQGLIYGFQDLTDGNKPWIFDQHTIDKYRVSQGQNGYISEDEQIALDIVEGLSI